MPKLVALSRERHAGQRWKRYDSYAFAGASALVDVVAAELPKAVLSLPLAFVRQGDAFTLNAVLGLAPGRNLCVTREGRWVGGGYVPAALRGYPFRLAHVEGDQLVLCIDEDSGLLTEGEEGEALFDEAGEPAAAITKVLEFLQQVEANRQVTVRACAALAEAGLIVPWAIKLQGEEGEREIEGLFRVDEAALNQLDAETLGGLRASGALSMAYCQLLSMQHLHRLGQLAKAHAQRDEAAAKQARAMLDQPEEEGFEFDWDALTR
ncbi:SapC family protein [Marichromatium bheemlicum]|uniref:SapC family protein n=1 Tax=Marichromatium bheemlicum TaxID=365339 RepID=A0ABX1I5N1_9GAMM|nr:SapC family protein [Marichromatium bheemlicum]NKN32889.1 SapC family protein [Marichromatium bheemlicum]